MKITENIEYDTPVLTLEGKLMGEPDTRQVHDHVMRLVAHGFKDVIWI